MVIFRCENKGKWKIFDNEYFIKLKQNFNDMKMKKIKSKKHDNHVRSKSFRNDKFF